MTMTVPVANAAIEFAPPAVEPVLSGLYQATRWTEAKSGPSRFLLAGVRIRGYNYAAPSSSGVWGAGWCGEPTGEKTGERPDFLDPFDPTTCYAFDRCDLSADSRAEVRRNAHQWLALTESVSVEREFAARMLVDAGTPVSADTLVEAVGALEGKLAVTGTIGFIHASPEWAAVAASQRLMTRDGDVLTTPLGHRWVFGAGYVEGLGTTLVATSQPYGWRDNRALRDIVDHEHNTYVAVAERNALVGYEHAIGAAEVTP